MTEALNNGLAAIDAAVPNSEDPKQQLIAAKCRGLLIGYHNRWKDAGYEPLNIEQFVESDLWNPATQRKSRTFRVAGVLDLVASRDGKIILFDHKTTSEDISDPDSFYWRQLRVESQPSHYMLLEWLNGRKMDGAVWDVVRKPAIRPKDLSKADVQRAVMTKHYCGSLLTDEEIQDLTANGRETLRLYTARLAEDCTASRPEWYFQRRSVPRLDADLLEHATEIWEHGQEILHARNMNRHARNSGACMLYKTPCKFLGICSGYDTPDSDKWQRKAIVHAELPIAEGDGRDILTHTRIRCFQTCRRKHYFEYELGIERLDEEEREALIFGSVWHAGLNAWFLSQLKGEPNGITITGDGQATDVCIVANND